MTCEEEERYYTKLTTMSSHHDALGFQFGFVYLLSDLVDSGLSGDNKTTGRICVILLFAQDEKELIKNGLSGQTND